MIDLNRSLLKKRSEYQKRQHKVIFFHDNAPSHTAKPVRDTLETLSWEVLPHAAYSPDLAPPDYHLFASMGRTYWAALSFVRRCEKMARWMVRGKRGRFFWRGIHKLSERWEKCVTRSKCVMEHTLNKSLFIILPNLMCFFGKKIVISYLYTWTTRKDFS